MSARTLNGLYGRGTSQAFAAATGGSEVAEVAFPGGVRVYVHWPNGSRMKIDCFPDRVHFLSLHSKRKGLYSDLCDALPDLFCDRGVERFTMSAADEKAEAILLKRGKWERVERGWEWVI